MVNNVPSGMSMCGEGSGFISPARQCGEEDHSGGTTPKPVSGNVTFHSSSGVLLLGCIHTAYSYNV